VLFLGTGIASIQLLPTLELYTRSVIDVTTSSFIIGRFLLPAPHFISLLIPNFFGNQGTYNYFGAGDFVESMTALGSIPLLLALASAYSDKFPRRLFLFLVFSALAAIMLSISSPITRFIYGIGVPIFSTSVPSRILMLAVFSLSVLAGFGADFLCSQKRRKEIGKAMVYIGFLLVSVLLYALFFLVTRAPCPSASIVNCRMISVRTTFFELIVFLLWSLSLFVSIKAKALWIQNMFVFLSIFIVAAGGLYNAQKLLPFSPKEMMYPKSEVIQTLQSLGGSGRVFGIGEGKIATDIATELRISDPEYYDPLYIRRYGELVAYANQGIYPSLLARSDVEIVRDATVSAEVHFRRNRLFDLLSVRYLYGKLSDFPGDLFGNTIWQGTAYRIVERLAPLPHAYFVHQYIAKKTNQEILSALFDPSFNPHVSVLLEKDIPLDVSVPSPVLSLSDFIVQKTVQNEYLKFWVKTNAPGVFVLTDNFYPGWQAVVDGKKAQIYRANYTFRAVALAQGEHTVEFFYQPNSLTIGILFAFVCILVLVAFVGPLTRLIESII
jgi:hypothetical protein